MTKMYDILKKAEESGLQDPRYTYITDDGRRVVFYLTAKRAVITFANYAYITINGEYKAKITKDGNCYTAPAATKEEFELIARINKDPISSAIYHGRRHSNCCFCGTDITSKNSLEVGYGPICAEKWGLPWGDGLAVREAAKEEHANQAKATNPILPSQIFSETELLNAFVDWLSNKEAFAFGYHDSRGREWVAQFLKKSEL